MVWNLDVSDEVKLSTEIELSKDGYASQIDSLDKQIASLESEIDSLKFDRNRLIKDRPPVVIKWRDSIKWCLSVDAKNWRYFLKSTPGVYKCIAYRHKVEATGDIKNKIAVTLSSLFKEGAIGRVNYNGTYLYGLTEFFTNDLTVLKEEFQDGLERLIIQN